MPESVGEEDHREAVEKVPDDLFRAPFTCSFELLGLAPRNRSAEYEGTRVVEELLYRANYVVLLTDPYFWRIRH